MQSRSGWQRRFDEPVVLPDGRKLKTLAEAIAWRGERNSEVRAPDGEGADRGALRDAGCGARRPNGLRPDGNAAGDRSIPTAKTHTGENASQGEINETLGRSSSKSPESQSHFAFVDA